MAATTHTLRIPATELCRWIDANPGVRMKLDGATETTIAEFVDTRFETRYAVTLTVEGRGDPVILFGDDVAVLRLDRPFVAPRF